MAINAHFSIRTTIFIFLVFFIGCKPSNKDSFDKLDNDVDPFSFINDPFEIVTDTFGRLNVDFGDFNFDGLEDYIVLLSSPPHNENSHIKISIFLQGPKNKFIEKISTQNLTSSFLWDNSFRRFIYVDNQLQVFHTTNDKRGTLFYEFDRHKKDFRLIESNMESPPMDSVRYVNTKKNFKYGRCTEYTLEPEWPLRSAKVIQSATKQYNFSTEKVYLSSLGGNNIEAILSCQ